MTELILYIGLPKTGTSTLQWHVLAAYPGYVGKRYPLTREDFARRLVRLAPVAPNKGSADPDGRQWAHDLQSYQAQHLPQERRVIVSDELLSGRGTRRRRDRWPVGFTRLPPQRVGSARNRAIAPFLGRLAQTAWTAGPVKVVVVVRNQPDWLASLYVEQSKDIFYANQDHFERQVDALLEANDDYIDWSKWVADLRDNLGDGNVCVLLSEDMQQPDFWKRLGDFAQLDDLPIDTLTQDSGYRANVRSAGANRWSIQERRRAPARQEQLAMQIARAADRLRPARARRTTPLKRDASVAMHADLRARILAHCEPFNRRLANQLGRDLSALGYGASARPD